MSCENRWDMQGELTWPETSSARGDECQQRVQLCWTSCQECKTVHKSVRVYTLLTQPHSIYKQDGIPSSFLISGMMTNQICFVHSLWNEVPVYKLCNSGTKKILQTGEKTEKPCRAKVSGHERALTRCAQKKYYLSCNSPQVGPASAHCQK